MILPSIWKKRKQSHTSEYCKCDFCGYDGGKRIVEKENKTIKEGRISEK
jgi:hypothetical protein